MSANRAVSRALRRESRGSTPHGFQEKRSRSLRSAFGPICLHLRSYADPIFFQPPAVAALLLALLVGCASAPVEAPAPVVAPLPETPEVWRLVDADIWGASRQAAAEAERYAYAALGAWMARVGRQTEEAFIPWYTSYGTQQWLALKVGWYGLDSAEGERKAADRLAEYLQEQYDKRVLQPVSEEPDPQKIRERAAAVFVRSLATELRDLPDRYRLAEDGFRQRLERIAVIELAAPAPQRASLAQILAADDPVSMPAYAALLSQIGPDEDGLSSGIVRDRLYPFARSSTDKLAGRLALQGGATVAGLALGGIGGILVSVGVSGWQAMEHEKNKPALEAELRSSLETALDEAAQFLRDDPYAGVAAPVHHMRAQIESGLLSVAILEEHNG
jgi:hypothetical protein